ncbi:glycosyltransferase family protein [Roseobacter ponti]|uniref:Glycosyltransferase n=1 Tax=Roseobacter ponti TaxID=1891787 RepID=A0A858SY36_9RHOB|nr:glycosyltransferase [Roseobacter ponti]QJF52563.1 glycosyltransferase [Roseobacter ponti]
MKVMIVVTHLLGSGHLARALTLTRAFRASGHSVHLVSGGQHVPHLLKETGDVTELEPLRSDGVNFTRLLDRHGDVAGPKVFDDRIRVMLSRLDQIRPDVLITELFPFGRRVLRAEFTALLKAAHAMTPKPLICSSVRDILAPPSKPAKAAMADDITAQFYNAVLVHADPEITPLEMSWPVSGTLRPFLHYTGYVAADDAGPHPDRAGAGEILVSAGGGSVGDPVYEAALGAAALTPDRTWRLLAGGKDAEQRVARLAERAPANAIAEPARPDFRQMLRHVAVSVSMCGYNTALDILQAGTPAVFIPFDEGGEVEQGLRARALSRLDGIEVILTADLTHATLAAAVARVQRAPRRARRTDLSGGARRSVEIVAALRAGMT